MNKGIYGKVKAQEGIRGAKNVESNSKLSF